MAENLAELRRQIDALDDRLLELLNARAKLAQKIGQRKRGPIYRPEREAQILRRLREGNAGPLSDSAVETLFREIMSACRAVEAPLTVAFLGPEGTFSEAAAIKQFGHSVRRLAVADIDAVFAAVERGEAHYGVVPVENSHEGAVGRTLDCLLATPLMVCGEVMLRVRQNLLRRGEGLAGVRVVYSHAQSLAQCQGWLARHLPAAERVSVASNAEAARRAAQEAEAAAIAGVAAAKAYGLNVVARGIEDDPRNTTRFLVLGAQDAAPSGQDKTSLAIWAENRPGALLELLQPFARNGVSLNKLESRPAKSGAWEYVFFIDLDGHRESPPVADALAKAGRHARSLRILGSYPAAIFASSTFR